MGWVDWPDGDGSDLRLGPGQFAQVYYSITCGAWWANINGVFGGVSAIDMQQAKRQAEQKFVTQLGRATEAMREHMGVMPPSP